jgi:hypothetical protein
MVLLASVLAAAFIVSRHKDNLERLHAGTESVFRWKAEGPHAERAMRHGKTKT